MRIDCAQKHFVSMTRKHIAPCRSIGKLMIHKVTCQPQMNFSSFDSSFDANYWSLRHEEIQFYLF